MSESVGGLETATSVDAAASTKYVCEMAQCLI